MNDAVRYRKTDRRTDRDNKKSFHEELEEDIRPLRADRPFDADLFYSLLYHNVHDVGDADPADRQRETPNQPHEQVECKEEIKKEFIEHARIPDPDGIVVGRVEPVPFPEHLPHLAVHLFRLRRVLRLKDNVLEMDLTENGGVCRSRNKNPVLVA